MNAAINQTHERGVLQLSIDPADVAGLEIWWRWLDRRQIASKIYVSISSIVLDHALFCSTGGGVLIAIGRSSRHQAGQLIAVITFELTQPSTQDKEAAQPGRSADKAEVVKSFK